MYMEKHPETNFFKNLIFGGIAAGTSKTIVAPLDRVKLLLQAQNASSTIALDKRYKGIFDVLTRVPKEQGFFSLWRGNWTNVLRYFPTQALNFACKDAYKGFFFSGVDKKREFWKFFGANLLCGSAAGVTTMSFVYPLDFARTRLALDVGTSRSREYSGLTDCLRKVLRQDGLCGLYRGFTVSVFTVITYRGLYFGLFDTSKAIFNVESSFIVALALAQAITSFATIVPYPFDTLRRRMLVNSETKKFWNFFRTTIRNEGILSLYKGFWANILRGTGGALVLPIYDKIQTYNFR